MLTIQVISQSSGNPLKGKRLSVAFDGLFRGVTKSMYSDNRGFASFDTKPGKGTVYVNGKSVYKGRIEGNTIVYV